MTEREIKTKLHRGEQQIGEGETSERKGAK
jgi:hypothetical protein